MVALLRRLDTDTIETKAVEKMARKLATGPGKILARLAVTLHDCLYPPLWNKENRKNQENEDNNVHQSGRRVGAGEAPRDSGMMETSQAIRPGSNTIMKFCSSCASPVTLRVPEGDNRPRFVCDSCHTIHYSNPNIVTGCIAEWEDRILLCKRAIEPRYGLWTLPAGFMENGETTPEAAVRETIEEAGARVEITSLFSLFNLPHIDQVYLIFRARLLDLEFGPGDESLEVELLEESAIPWEQMAFPAIKESLKLYFRDRARGHFGTHIGDIERLQGEPRRYRIQMLDNQTPVRNFPTRTSSP